MRVAAASRHRLAKTLEAAYAEGLISQRTLSVRLDQVLRSRVIDPQRLVGDLYLRLHRASLKSRVSQTMHTIAGRIGDRYRDIDEEPPLLLALEWTAEPQELLIGRGRSCDVLLSDPTVSRRHARLIFRDGRWVLQDLESTNGSEVNGLRVTRCLLQPGDTLSLGDVRLLVD